MYAVHKVIKIRILSCIQYINRLVRVRNSKPLLLVPKIGVPLNPLDFPFNQCCQIAHWRVMKCHEAMLIPDFASFATTSHYQCS